MEKSYKFKYQSSKRALEAINRFNYYRQQVIPLHFDHHPTIKTNNLNDIKYACGINNIIYFWASKFIQGQLLVNQESILHAIKTTSLQKNNIEDKITKINQKSYKKLTILPGSYWKSQYLSSQVIQFVLKQGEHKLNRKLPYQLYIIHHCHNENQQQQRKQLKWLHFVQKYIFADDGIHYQIIMVANHQKIIFGLSSNLLSLQTFIHMYMKLQRFQGQLLKYQDTIKKQIQLSQDPAFSQQHRLINSIPSQFLKTFFTLKNYFGAEHQQLICRFMLARQFNLQQSKKGIQQYLQYMKMINEKYKWQDFQQFHKANIYYELGEDYKGRPVILNMAKNVLVDEMDKNLYCIYFIYFLQVYMAKKMRGHVTQLNIIADVADIGTRNFQLAITRRNIQDGGKYCVERQYKFFAVNISSFANFCYKFIKPLLPKKTSQKVYIGGNDKKQIVQNLLKDMSIDVIPTYLGGRNPII